MKIKKIIASVLTFMMLFMNVPTNVFAEDGFTDISYFLIENYADAISKINECSWAEIESTDPANKVVKIKLLNDILGEIDVNCDDGTYIILNANGHTISGGGASPSSHYQAIKLAKEHVTMELVGNGTYVTGYEFALANGSYNNQFILKSGTIIGKVSSFLKVELEEGCNYYIIDFKTNDKDIIGQDYKKIYTSATSVDLYKSSASTFTVTQYYHNIQFIYNANGGRGTMDDVFLKNGEEFTLPECGYRVPDNGKHFKGWQIEDDGSIYKAGEKITIDTDNGVLQTKTIKAIWEEHSYNQEVVDAKYLKKKATCTSNAKYYTSCICGAYDYSVSTEFEVPNSKTAHTYTKQMKTTKYLKSQADTCQEHDIYWYACINCEQSAEEDSNAQDKYYKDTKVGEHQYSDKLSSNDTEHYYECTVKGCTSKKDVQKHTASNWIIDEEATLEKEGTKHKECTVCGRILETEKISKKESGTVEKKDDANITINNDVDHLSKNILTEQEVEKVKQGENAQIYVDVKDEANKTDLEQVNASLNNYKLGKVYDISLWLKVGENTRQVTTSKEKLGMSLKVPEELINKDSKVKRTYKVMRIHEGKATLLDGTYDEKTQMITFETDQFSTYALVYSDTKVETPSTKEDNSDKKNDEVVDKDDKKKEEVVNKDNSTSNNQETVKPTLKEETVTPTVEKETKTTVKAENKTETKKVKTGDDLFVGGFAFFLVVSLIGMIYLRKKVSK